MEHACLVHIASGVVEVVDVEQVTPPVLFTRQVHQGDVLGEYWTRTQVWQQQVEQDQTDQRRAVAQPPKEEEGTVVEFGATFGQHFECDVGSGHSPNGQ